MTPDELRLRILAGENVHTDFKERVGATIDLAKDLVCFANTDGGQLILGVADDSRVVGVTDVDRLLLLVDDVAFNLCSPPVTVVPETVRHETETVVVLNIAKGDQRPYATNDGRHYVRSGPRCRRASREELLRLFQAAGSLFFDEQALRTRRLSDLDVEAVTRYMAAAGLDDLGDDLPRILKAWRLSDGEHPTVSGVVLFGRAPQTMFPACGVVAGAVAGVELGGDFIDRKDLTGGLFEVVDQAQTFLRLHLRTGHVIVDFQPEVREEIPLAALREAIVNALVHRDYTIPGPTRIFVFADRVEIHSPGRPPNSVDESAMRAGVHVTRNPHIYSRVAEAQLATRAGTGIRRIARLLRERSGAELGISISDAEVVLTLPRATRSPEDD
jgi:ATP-dependent DNA helicase RecG